MEIIFNGNIVPLSKFMFDPGENVNIIWKEISNLSLKNDRVIEGYSKLMHMSLTTMKLKPMSKQEKRTIVKQKTS